VPVSKFLSESVVTQRTSISGWSALKPANRGISQLVAVAVDTEMVTTSVIPSCMCCTSRTA